MTDRTHLHDYKRSRAVLVGTSDYTHLPPVPAAANSLHRMAGMLTSDLCGWPRERISIFSNEPGPGDLPDRLITLFEEARDVALFYFVGHGQVDVEDQLCLGLVSSRLDPHRRASTSLQFHSVRRAMLGSPATTKIIILDCCFAGLANKPSNTLGAADLLDKVSGTGAYTMAASGSYTTAWYEKRSKKVAQAYFTKYLVDLIQTGIVGEPAGLRLRVLFGHLREKLGYDGRPLPEDRNIDNAGDFIFAHNAAPLQARANSSPGALAAQEAQLGDLRAMLTNLSRRNQSLIERQLSLIDSLEQAEQDPERLSSLYRLDHLATRMRRTSENLLVLAGHEGTRRWSQPVPLVDVLRAAVSEIEQYERVVLNVQPGIVVVGQAVNDVVHLVAEIVENATTFSPEDTQVYVSGQPLESGGVLLDITDNGIGMLDEEISQANWRLENSALVEGAVSRRMGLFLVGRLAARHAIRVRLRRAVKGGVTALVWLPEAVAGSEIGKPNQPLCEVNKCLALQMSSGPFLLSRLVA